MEIALILVGSLMIAVTKKDYDPWDRLCYGMGLAIILIAFLPSG